MRHAFAVLVLLIAGLGLGWALPHPVPARDLVLAGPVCGPTRPEVRPVHVSCDVARHDTCWEALSARLAPHPTTGVGFEAASEVELPENYVPIVEEEIARCDPSAVVEVTDCSTYPCVSAVRASDGWLASPCAWTSAVGEAELVSLPIDVACPGGTERMIFTTLVDEASARAAIGLGADEEPNGLLAGLIGQRVDTLLEMWPCTGS
jgi:hypothetical protein